ncbi:MAG: hypothetical protein BEN19_02805 [Epulopiscium sp. Nuni2H_MBin003]|nr:MAG: hypothetical protein BEN19_02805 [Epulopiscium sp. Nuni2H_MBin003]
MPKINFDPRAKFLVFIVACVFCMNVSEPLPAVAFGTFVWVLLVLSGKPRSGTIMYLTFMACTVWAFLIITFTSTVWTMPLMALFVYGRIYIPMIMSFVFVFQTTKISEFMAAFEKIHAPSAVIIPFAIFFRFMPTVQEEWKGISQAMAFRGIGLKFSSIFFHPIQTAEYILVPLLSSCVGVMDELVAASLARGLDSDKKRTCFLEVSMKLQDYFIMMIALGFLMLK